MRSMSRMVRALLPAVLAVASAPAWADDMDTAACLQQLRPQAVANGVSLADFDRYTQGATLLASTVSSARRQPEGREAWWDYLAKTVDDERIADGRAVLQRPDLTQPLQDIGQRYAVDPAALVAIFGIESNYGRQMGRTKVLDAWLTRACTERNPLWKKNVYASIRLLRDGIVPEEGFVGSWSGAFGMTQFIPTSFYELAADGDGDGHIDLYNSFADALASSASHLRKRGVRWAHNVPPVIEVSLPAALAQTLPERPDAEVLNKEFRTLAQWRDAGVTQATGADLLQSAWHTGSEISASTLGAEPANLFAPAGRNGPVFLTTGNFNSILHYNQSRRYALAVSLLANSLQGQQVLVHDWPTDDGGLSRAEIRQLQQWLLDRGHDVGTPDGIPGLKTREAISAEQQRLGLPEDGRAGRRVYNALAPQ
ncbi:lytic murein transglycosylase [Corticimicrobacter populi]|uniref:Type III effector n=1 Tax=Corticimicrobacter populi TaxID=2175229 RepID=A0A2V1K6Y0_9BURK|nr:lytic murein transglycosylase [Corticimicrobacter populi]PWF25297.1 type III effector [Corticimicrobacter populi]QDQ87234.1 lytic murein transglycosylase [Alcaligenaceae bacterium SJ-26]